MDLNTFESLYRTCQPAMVRLAFHYLGDENRAIDLVQDLFVSFWEKRDEHPAISNVRAYLMTSVRNRCLNALNREKSVISMDLLEDIAISRDSVTDDLESRQTREEIMQMVARLPEKCREIFILSRFEDMSYTEIANLLGISYKTVENQVGNALKFLRRKLK